jgi:enoyl-CoA hydratase/carnithine racemase
VSVLVETDGHVAVCTLNRPDKLNAIDIETVDGIEQFAIRLRDDDELRVGILTGAGERAFSAGADLRKLPAQLAERGGDAAGDIALMFRRLGLLKPTIAAVNGLAYGGGCELALACDLRVLAEGARMALPEPRRGLIPGWGGTQRLPRAVPLGIAYELLFTGRDVDAAEALRIGLANRVAPDALTAARALAAEICAVSPSSVRLIKEAVQTGLDGTLEEGIRTEAELLRRTWTTADAAEGMASFLERREPVWSGR